MTDLMLPIAIAKGLLRPKLNWNEDAVSEWILTKRPEWGNVDAYSMVFSGRVLELMEYITN